MRRTARHRLRVGLELTHERGEGHVQHRRLAARGGTACCAHRVAPTAAAPTRAAATAAIAGPLRLQLRVPRRSRRVDNPPCLPRRLLPRGHLRLLRLLPARSSPAAGLNRAAASACPSDPHPRCVAPPLPPPSPPPPPPRLPLPRRYGHAPSASSGLSHRHPPQARRLRRLWRHRRPWRCLHRWQRSAVAPPHASPRARSVPPPPPPAARRPPQPASRAAPRRPRPRPCALPAASPPLSLARAPRTRAP
eukprot:scaffold103185_cov63-Phaeocystis_antarctica.AAC.4